MLSYVVGGFILPLPLPRGSLLGRSFLRPPLSQKSKIKNRKKLTLLPLVPGRLVKHVGRHGVDLFRGELPSPGRHGSLPIRDLREREKEGKKGGREEKKQGGVRQKNTGKTFQTKNGQLLLLLSSNTRQRRRRREAANPEEGLRRESPRQSLLSLRSLLLLLRGRRRLLRARASAARPGACSSP